MRKWVVVLGVTVGAIVLVGGGAGLGAYQASRQQQVSADDGGRLGPMMARGSVVQEGPLHESMMEALAQALGVPATELEDRLTSGESLASIAEEQGLSADELQTAWSDAWQQALDTAVEDGQLTKEQADWMRDHMRAVPAIGRHPMGGGDGRGLFGPGWRGEGGLPGWDPDTE